MSKPMSRRTRSLLFAVIALAAVAVLLVGLLFLLPEPAEEPQEEVRDDTVVLLDKTTAKDVTLTSAEIAIGNAKHTITINEDKVYTLKGFDDLPMEQSVFEEVAETLLSVKATRLIDENPATPSDFGFTTPDLYITVSATYSDNTSFALEIGNLAPSKEGYYLREVGKPAVYLMDTTFCETVSYEFTAYLNHAPIVAPDTQENGDTVVVRDCTLSGKARPSKIRFQVAEEPANAEDTMIISGFVIQEPYFHAVDSNSQLIAAATFTSLSASGVAKIRPTAADLAAFGITNPYSACDVSLSLKRANSTTDEDGETTETVTYHNTFRYTVKIGNETEDGLRYGAIYTEGKLLPVIYLFDPSAVIWLDMQYDDIADSMLYFQYIHNVNSLTFTADGKTTVFQLSHDRDEEDSDKSLTVTADGKTYPTSDFRTLYANLLGMYRVGGTTEKLTGTPLLSVTFSQSAAHGGNVRIDIYSYTAGHCIAVHSTGEKHLVNMKDVQNYMDNLQDYLDGKAIS